MIDLFMNKLNSEMINHISKKKSSLKRNNTPLSEETRKTIRQKHRAWEKYMNTNSDDNYRLYTRARNKAKNESSQREPGALL